MNKSDLIALARGASPTTALVDMDVANVRELEAGDGSVFAEAGYKADAWKAFIEFDICHSFPTIIGPTMQGDLIGYHPATLEASHESLRFQQVNLRHMLKAYNPEKVTRDRIVGCVVATSFPKPPYGGWKIPAAGESVPCIHACAVIFKLAEGVPNMLGKHQASREKQSVSIESICHLMNIGVYVPETAEVYALDELPDELIPLVSIEKDKATGAYNLRLKPYKGKPLIKAMGARGAAVDFRGVGITPMPAERTARITAVSAERHMVAVAAQEMPSMMTGLRVSWDGARYRGVVRKAHCEGRWYGREATDEQPLIEVMTPRGVPIFKRLGELSSIG